MTQKQIRAMHRILAHERKSKGVNEFHPKPGLHPCYSQHLISDDYVTIILNQPLEGVPIGSRMDSMGGTISRECNRGLHYPLEDSEINPDAWRQLKTRDGKDKNSVELSVIDEDGEVIRGQFSPRCLLDALDAAGKNPCFYLGYGGMTLRYPTLLIAPRESASNDGPDIVRVLPLRG